MRGVQMAAAAAPQTVARVQLHSDEDDIEWPKQMTAALSEEELQEALEPWVDFCSSAKNILVLKLSCVKTLLWVLPLPIIVAVVMYLTHYDIAHIATGCIGGLLLGAAILNLLNKLFFAELEGAVWEVARELNDRLEPSGLFVSPGFQEMSNGCCCGRSDAKEDLEDTDESHVIWLDLKPLGPWKEVYVPRPCVYHIASPDTMVLLGMAIAGLIFGFSQS
eukprot:gb/GFBE01060773.1/.p1 GENE.gb/GFBE01060773.1/~~gb/GFBE01060773.1/.p1  ORF type:complete len:220 (+),score=46.95 gb/GFBE01060773.1/:1-660(+)